MSGGALDPAAAARLRRLGGAKLLRDMIALFLTNGPLRLASAEAGLAGGDLREAERAWHTLKSSAGNLGATGLQQAAEAAETAAAAGERDAAAAASVRVATEYQAAAAALAGILRELGNEDDRADRG